VFLGQVCVGLKGGCLSVLGQVRFGLKGGCLSVLKTRTGLDHPVAN
jgi:hypothetical protein